MNFKRHDLIWVYGDNTPYVVTRQTNMVHEELIVARSYSSEKDISSRINKVIQTRDIMKHQRPYSLKKILQSEMAPLLTDCRRSILKIAEYYKLYGIKIYVYGSTSWQYITDNTHLHPKSDLDLLIEVDDITKLHLLHDLIHDLNELSKMKLDGELLLKGEMYIAINEWLKINDEDQVLVKTDNDVYLTRKIDVLNAK